MMTNLSVQLTRRDWLYEDASAIPDVVEITTFRDYDLSAHQCIVMQSPNMAEPDTSKP